MRWALALVIAVKVAIVAYGLYTFYTWATNIVRLVAP